MKAAISLSFVLMTGSLVMAAGAHTHGHAEASVAFDGAKGKVEFKAASDDVIGFEHVAKSEKDQKKQAEQLKKLEKQFPEMIRFESALKCKFKKEKIENGARAEATIENPSEGHSPSRSEGHSEAPDDNHTDVVAIFAVECAKSPLGSTLVFSFKKYFPGLSDVDIQILVDNLQKSAEVGAKVLQVELK